MKKYIILLLYAFTGWGFCATIMGIGPELTSMENTLIIHLLAGPSGFGFLSAVYHRKFRYTRPIITAVVFLLFVILMDFFLVGLIILKNLDMFTSIIGTWSPFILIFITTYIAGIIADKGNKNEN